MTMHMNYDDARERYTELKKMGFDVVLKRPINGRKYYEVVTFK